MALGMDVELRDKEGKLIDMDDLARQTQKEEQRSMNSIRSIGEDRLRSEEEPTSSIDQDVADEMLN